MNEITRRTQPLLLQLSAPALDFHARGRMEEGSECTDWYSCEKELSIEQAARPAIKQLQKA